MRGAFNLFAVVFSLVGVGMLIVVGFVTAESLEKANNGIRVEGIVVEANDNQKPVVEFRTRDGQRLQVEGSISVSPTPYRVGERIGVFYDPADPADALIDAFIERWFLTLLFGGFAAVFTAIGLGFTVTALHRRARRTGLIKTGQRFDGHIVGFEQNRFTKINGKRPWQVLVTWTDAQNVAHSIHSEMQREDPAQRFKVGDRVTVIADPNNPNKAWVDLLGDSMANGPSSSSSAIKSDKLGNNTSTPIVRRR